jgi:hypothetical protein
MNNQKHLSRSKENENIIAKWEKYISQYIVNTDS